MAILTITGFTFAQTPAGNQTVYIKWRQTSQPDVDANYTSAPNAIVNSAGTIVSPSPYLLAVPDVNITLKAYTSCTSPTPYKEGFITPIYEWVCETSICEQDGLFTLEDTFTGFSSPSSLYYDSTTGRYYVADHDETSGNFYWFNPNTITGAVSSNFIAGSTATLYTTLVDEQYKRIYGIGKDSGGVKVLNIATNTISTVAYGEDGNDFNRQCIAAIGNIIYANDQFDSGGELIVLINRATLGIITTHLVSALPSGTTYIQRNFRMTLVDGNVWITAAQRLDGNIGIYSTNLTTLVDEIDTSTFTNPPAIVPGWGSNMYWQSSYYDEEKDRFYLHDLGSNRLYVINTLTKTLVSSRLFSNREGKDYTTCFFTRDPITGDLYIGITCLDSPSDVSTTKRTYKINRNTYDIDLVYPGEAFSQLVRQGTTNILFGINAMHVSWEGTPDWDTDGEIYKYSK